MDFVIDLDTLSRAVRQPCIVQLFHIVAAQLGHDKFFLSQHHESQSSF